MGGACNLKSLYFLRGFGDKGSVAVGVACPGETPVPPALPLDFPCCWIWVLIEVFNLMTFACHCMT